MLGFYKLSVCGRFSNGNNRKENAACAPGYWWALTGDCCPARLLAHAGCVRAICGSGFGLDRKRQCHDYGGTRAGFPSWAHPGALSTGRCGGLSSRLRTQSSFSRAPRVISSQQSAGLSVAGAVRRYHANPNVLYAEPDFYVQAVTTTPTDPLWSQQYDMAKIAAPAAWDTQTNAGDVIVAIIDTGIDFTHPDLQGNLWTDPGNSTTHGF